MQVQYASAPSNRPASARPASAGHVQGGVMGADSSSSSDSSSDSDEEQRHTGATHKAHGTHQAHGQPQRSPQQTSIPSSPQQRIPGGLLKRPPPLSPLRSARADQPHDSQPGEPSQPSQQPTHTTHAPAVPPKEVTWSQAGSAASSKRASLVRVDSEFEHSGAFPSSEAHISASAHPAFAAEALASERVRLDAETRRQELALKAKRMSLDRRESRSRDASRAASLASTPTAAATPHGPFGAPSALMLPPLATAIAAPAASASVSASAPVPATTVAVGRPSPSSVVRSLHPTVQRIEKTASAAASGSPLGADGAALPGEARSYPGVSAPPAAESSPAVAVVANSSPALSDGATSSLVTADPSHQQQQQSACARFVPPPLSSFVPGVHHLCDVCDERQARVFCADCNQRMCLGTTGGAAGAAGATVLKGCAVERHRKGGRMTAHRLLEWTAKGAGRHVTIDQDEGEASSHVNTAQPQASPASTVAAPLSSAPAVPTPTSEDDAALSELPTPPALGALSPASSRTSLCEVCDAHQARVFCAECNLALCWGSRPGPGGGQEGCVVELHPDRDQARAGHRRFEIDARGGRGRLLPFVRGMSRSDAIPVRPASTQSGAVVTPVAAASCPAAPNVPPAAAAVAVALQPSTLQQVYADPSAWSASHVCCWLRGAGLSACSYPPALPGAFLDAGVCGGALLRLDEETLRRELGVQDPSVRQRILTAVAALRAESAAMLGSTAPVDSASLRAQLRAQARAMLLERGVDDTEEPESGFPESSASASVPYSRAQLHFMLAERNRMIARLHEENQKLARQLQQLSVNVQ